MADAEDVEGLSELVLLPTGSTFGNYVIHECIGQGAMGNVYRAEHALLEKPVALKVMDTSLLQSADARQRFLREGQAAAAIKHPNVVDITDVGVFEGTPYLVMELLEGEDLQIYLARGEPLSEREIAALIIPITAALGAAHDRGVVHRDLKPSNIFLARGPDGEVIPKILDFGISKVAQVLASDDFESTPFNQLMGSPLYLPPEAVRGARDLTAKSDQYSLGVVLYECVTGRPPFSGDTLLSVLNSIASGQFVRPSRLRSDISLPMDQAIVRALNPDPSLRFQHVRDLGRELLDVAGVRTQMLWGRTFGRIDLSEPPSAPRSIAPVALLRLESAPVTPASPPRSRHIWLGVATLAVLLASNFWAMRFQSGPASGANSEPPRLAEFEAPLTPARRAAAPESLMPALGEPARDAVPNDAIPSAAVPHAVPPADPVELPAMPAGRVISVSPVESPAMPARTNPPARAVSNGAATGSTDRPRPNRRARLSTLVDPRPHRLSSVNESRPRARSEIVAEPLPDDPRDLFSVPGSRDGMGREGSVRPSPRSVYVGANESPILD